MKIGYILIDKEKEEFLQNTLKDHNLSGQLIESVNSLEVFLNTMMKSLKNNDIVIFDFKLFNDTIKAISKIREFERLYDIKKYILLFDNISEDIVEEFKINSFYNIALNNNDKLLNDILENKVDENYQFTKSDEEKIDENFYILKNDFTNIKVSCVSEDLSYKSFLTSVNIANYMDRIGINVAYLQYHNKEDYLYPFYEQNIFERFEDDAYKNKYNCVEYKVNDVPSSFYDKDGGCLIFCFAYLENEDKIMIKSDIQIIISDSNFSNIEKLKNQNIEKEKTYILIVDALNEQKEYINSLNLPNLYYIKSINSIFSLANSDTFKEIFKDFIEII